MYKIFRIVGKKLGLRPLYNKVKWCGTAYGFTRNYLIFPLQGFLRTHGFFKKHVEKITALKNKYVGKRVFIVATGPSLTLEDVNLLKNEYTIGVNSIFRLFDKTNWRPNFYICSDPALFESLYKNNDLKIETYAKNNVFLNSLNKKLLKNRSGEIIFIDTCFLDHVYNYGKSKDFRYTEDLRYGIYDYYSVTHDSICLAMYMGFSEIYLIGVDNNYMGKKQHFDNTAGESDMDYETAVIVQKSMDAGYDYLSKIADKNNYKIFNATRGGCVKAFPRVNIETVLDK